MSDRFLYGRSSDGTLVRTFRQEGDTTILGSHQDCEPIIENNKILRELTVQKKNEVIRHIASVPVHVYEQAVREGWANDEDMWTRWLNDGDNRDFRVMGGKV